MVTLPARVVVPAPVIRLVSAVVPPTTPPKLVAPPPLRVKANAPFSVPPTPTLPEPAVTTVAPVRVVLPAIETSLLVVVSVAAAIEAVPP